MNENLARKFGNCSEYLKDTHVFRNQEMIDRN